MMWIDSTLAGLMSGLAAMVGEQRFNLALQAEGRKSVESDWLLFSSHENFHDGFKELRINAAVAGWGDWQLIELDYEQKRCVFRAYHNWEGLYQKSLGVCWGSGMLAGKFSGICSKLFQTNCWAVQNTFIARGADYDEFVGTPSTRLLEDEIATLLSSDQATRADMAVAMKQLKERERLLHRANTDLQRFAEVSAHHLMEPTRRLNSYTQRLSQQLSALALPPAQSEAIAQNLEYLQRDAGRLYNRIRDIELYIAATDVRGKIVSENVNNLLAMLCEQWSQCLSEANISLKIDVLPNAYLDRPRLLDLFSLLIDNVVKHGRRANYPENLLIHISGERVGSLSRYRICDNGVGIATQFHGRVFGIFERLSHNHDLGTGIGLSIARRIVESRHGKIWLENSIPTGVTVAFELPDGSQNYGF
jgi:signal transduction histidine kinase